MAEAGVDADEWRANGDIVAARQGRAQAAGNLMEKLIEMSDGVECNN
ncbi:hypothetical protein NHJ13051_004113 [Beauveria bassiana]